MSSLSSLSLEGFIKDSYVIPLTDEEISYIATALYEYRDGIETRLLDFAKFAKQDGIQDNGLWRDFRNSLWTLRMQEIDKRAYREFQCLRFWHNCRKQLDEFAFAAGETSQ